MARRRGNKPGSKRAEKARKQRDLLSQQSLERKRKQLDALRKLARLSRAREQLRQEIRRIDEQRYTERKRQKGPVPLERSAVGRNTHTFKASVASERKTLHQSKLDKRVAPKVHSKNSPRAHCKEKPLNEPSRSFGAGGKPKRDFIPWCGADYGSHRRKR